ncbi:rod shape-determining protein MreD [Sphingorhabdus sp.]|jgi:rod shape-determining protein MreD|uniref:rod shape-determining protein MreD n=1 Tax=Sphingorhabdus sp. TaxID=1902408 RepID=UPI003784ECF4
MKIPVTTIRLPTRPTREYESRFDREQSLLKMLAIPIASVAIASMITALPIFTEEPLLPPLGLLMFLSWRLMRPGLLPVWSGVPFGLMDDVFSGQPFGSAGLLWSLAILVIEIIDARAIWRDHLQDWIIAAILIAAVLLGGLWIAGMAHAAPDPAVLIPQIILSILLYPLAVRICARLDNWRLAT